MAELYRAEDEAGYGFGFPTIAALDWDAVARAAKTKARTLTMNVALQSRTVGRKGYKTAVVVEIPQGTDAEDAKTLALAAMRDYVARARMDYLGRRSG